MTQPCVPELVLATDRHADDAWLAAWVVARSLNPASEGGPFLRVPGGRGVFEGIAWRAVECRPPATEASGYMMRITMAIQVTRASAAIAARLTTVFTLREPSPTGVSSTGFATEMSARPSTSFTFSDSWKREWIV